MFEIKFPKLDMLEAGLVITIVGVVANEKSSRNYHQIGWAERGTVFDPLAQDPPRSVSIAMRGSGAVLNTPTDQRLFLSDRASGTKFKTGKKGFQGQGATWLAPQFQSVIGSLIQWDDLIWKKRRHYSPV